MAKRKPVRKRTRKASNANPKLKSASLLKMGHVNVPGQRVQYPGGGLPGY